MKKIPFSEWVKQERARRCWSLEEMAEQLVLCSSLIIHFIEEGIIFPLPSTICKIAKAFAANPPIIPENVEITQPEPETAPAGAE